MSKFELIKKITNDINQNKNLREFIEKYFNDSSDVIITEQDVNNTWNNATTIEDKHPLNKQQHQASIEKLNEWINALVNEENPKNQDNSLGLIADHDITYTSQIDDLVFVGGKIGVSTITESDKKTKKVTIKNRYGDCKVFNFSSLKGPKLIKGFKQQGWCLKKVPVK